MPPALIAFFRNMVLTSFAFDPNSGIFRCRSSLQIPSKSREMLRHNIHCNGTEPHPIHPLTMRFWFTLLVALKAFKSICIIKSGEHKANNWALAISAYYIYPFNDGKWNCSQLMWMWMDRAGQGHGLSSQRSPWQRFNVFVRQVIWCTIIFAPHWPSRHSSQTEHTGW